MPSSVTYLQASYALNRAASIQLEFARHIELTGKPPEEPPAVVEEELEKAERTKEGERVLKEVAALAESRGYDAEDVRRFSEQ